MLVLHDEDGAAGLVGDECGADDGIQFVAGGRLGGRD
jgi:hypothetical protein